MKIVIVSASTRPNSQSRRAADYFKAQLLELGTEAAIVDLNEQRLPLYDDSDHGEWEPVWKPMSKELESADGFIFVCPEWAGTYGPGILNMFMYAEQELAHKPVMAVGVSSGRGGRYPLMDLRAAGYKNRHYVVTPESLVISDVKNVLGESGFTDDYIAKRSDYALKILLEYAKALQSVRSSGVVDHQAFPNGV